MKQVFIILFSAVLLTATSVKATEAVDFNKPVFTRDDALACPDLDSFYSAGHAKNNYWKYVPTAGVDMPRGAYNGMPVSPEYFGCTISSDGVAVRVTATYSMAVQTNIGWISYDKLRNVPSKEQPVYSRHRPTSCDKHGNNCVYTDVRPFQPVQDQ